jgi:CheY-like chemotaxis protein
LHGGTVRAHSAGLGQGSTFVVSLPLAIMHEPAVPLAHPKGAAGAGVSQDVALLSGLRILVVDDESDAREVMRRTLLAAHAEVATAGSVFEALATLRTYKADALVSDIGMPIQDGYELIKQARAEGLLARDAPAIAVTAFARPEDRRRILLSGFQMHIAKPVEPFELVAAIASLAGRTGGATIDGASDS